MDFVRPLLASNDEANDGSSETENQERPLASHGDVDDDGKTESQNQKQREKNQNR